MIITKDLLNKDAEILANTILENKDAIEVSYLNIYNGFLGLKQVSAISPRDKKYLNAISYDVFEND